MRVLTIIILSLVTVLGGFLLIHPIPIFTPTVLEAGDTYGNGAISREFRVFNLGLRRLNIDRYRGSCVCSHVDGPAQLSPFSWSTISVHIKSRGVSGPYRVDLVVEFAEESPKRLSIYGTRIIICRSDPEAVTLSPLDMISPNHLQDELTFVFSEPVSSEALSFTTDNKRLTVTPITKLTGNVSKVRVRLDYDCAGERGSFTDWVKIKYLMHKPGDYTVQVQGKLPGGLEVDPEQVDLSELDISSKPQLRLSVAGLQTGEKLVDIEFSGIEIKKYISWRVDDRGNLDLAFDKSYQTKIVAPFSMLARTNMGQTASVYFSR